MDSSSDSDEGDLPDISSLKPFCFEPEISLEEQQNISDDSSDSERFEEFVESRIGNNYWCPCGGHCKPMGTNAESLCCRDNNEIPD